MSLHFNNSFTLIISYYFLFTVVDLVMRVNSRLLYKVLKQREKNEWWIMFISKCQNDLLIMKAKTISNAIHTFFAFKPSYICLKVLGFQQYWICILLYVDNHFIKRDSRREVCTHFWSRSWTPSAGPGSLAWSPSTSWCWASPPLWTPGWRALGRWREPKNSKNSWS